METKMEGGKKVNATKKRVFLINVPSRRGKGGKILPRGLLHAGSSIERSGHSAKIYDPYLDDENLTNLDNGDFGILDGILEEYRRFWGNRIFLRAYKKNIPSREFFSFSEYGTGTGSGSFYGPVPAWRTSRIILRMRHCNVYQKNFPKNS